MKERGILFSAPMVRALLAAAPVHDKRCPAALNMSDPCNCGETS